MNGPTNDRARGTAALRRPLVLGVAWAASAAAAVGLGFLAVSLLDASASSGTPQVAAATSSAPEGQAGPTATRFVPKATSATGEFATAAGTVYATCGTGLPVLAGVPVAGWWIDDSGEQGKVEFQNGTQQIEVRVACVDGSPRFATEGMRVGGRRDEHLRPHASGPGAGADGRADDVRRPRRGRARGGRRAGRRLRRPRRRWPRLGRLSGTAPQPPGDGKHSRRLGDFARAAQDVDAFPPDAPRRPGRRRGRQPPPAGPGRLHPAGRARRVHVAAAGLPGVPQRRARHPRGDGRDGRAGGALPGAAAPRALRGDRPLDRVRPEPLPPEGPARQRLPARPHARGDVHAPGEGPLRLLQGPAGLALPDPDQVPGRGAAAGRAVPRPRVHHEGQLLLRRRRRRPRPVLRGAPRGLHQDLRPARPRLRDRVGDVGRDGWLQERGVPAPHGDR